MKIFVSNHLEVLAEALKEQLFQGHAHPFDKRWIIVPNERVKQDLFLRWARDPLLQVATGFKMITWSEALRRLFPGLPTKTELSLRIEAALSGVDDAQLFAYLKQGGPQRIASLCDRMSALFLQYLAQPEEKLMQWLAQNSWQQSLWHAVFGRDIPWKTQTCLEGSVYLFHPSQMALYQFAAFKKMEAVCFLFSPSAMYWGDLLTFREQRALLKRTEAFSPFFENENPLLANWGRQGRQLLRFFEDEEWVEIYEEQQNTSLLKTIQQEMLSLSQLEKIPDDSLQVHSASSKLREVEVVWEIIQRLPCEPCEILVLAPDMQSYAAAIELVFRQRGGSFDFSIFCVEARSASPLMQGVEDLLDLPRFRFSKEAVEKLLFSLPFLKKFGFEMEDVRLLERWMGRVNIRYDLRGDHAGSWEAGLKRLVEALVKTGKEDQLTLEFSQADLLSRWIEVIQLFEQLNVLESQLTLKEWSKALRSLVDKFFAPNPDDPLMHELEKLQSMKVEGIFPFSSMERLLKDIFRKKSGAVQASHLQAVRFASLEKGALIPAKAVILMGMEEGSFPRQDLSSSLQQLPLSSRVEEDKYLFLEALCSAREKFILTYIRLHPEDAKSQKACLLAEELIQYCKLPVVEHPFSPFDPSYFQGGGFQSFSKEHFEVVQQKSSIVLEKKVPILPELLMSALDIRMLRKLARHPLQFFFEERLGINFEWKERDTEFVLSPLSLSRLRKNSLKRPLEDLLSDMEKEGKLPVGSFSKVAIQKIHDEIETYHQMLEKLQVRPEEIYAIELKASCAEPTQIDEHTWIYPALRIKEMIIQGRIDELSPRGLLFHGDESLADQLKIWPLYLIAKNLLPSLPLLLTKKGKVSELNVEHPRQALERYLSYAEKALTMPSPLYPKWARGIFKEGKIPAASEEDEIIQWAYSRDLLPPSEPWLNAWSSYLQEVFHELL